MKIPFTTKLFVLGTLILVLGILLQPVLATSMALAQDNNAPVADTPTSEPPTPLPTATTVPAATATTVPAATATTGPAATNTPIIVPPKPSSGPVPIPEPVTVVLFGTGLAAISAAAAARRKKGN